MNASDLPTLLHEIRNCRHCEEHLPMGPRPILTASETSKILLIGQAPGIRVHESGIAWNDPSGKRLREWMGISETDFYDESKVAIVPMGFCFPGTGKSGDLAPRKECSQLWHHNLLEKLNSVELTILMGRYAFAFALGKRQKTNLTKTVKAWEEFAPSVLPLPHPSPRNNRWLKKNEWFEADVLPWLKRRVKRVLKKSS